MNDLRIVEKPTCFAIHRGNEVLGNFVGPDGKEHAQLFVAAPALLAHLKFAVTLLGAIPGIGGTAQVERMRAAIAAATHP